MTNRPPKPGELLAVAAALAVGAWLRFRHIVFIAFNRDAALLVDMADRLRAGERILLGIPSSKGIVNPPLPVYLVAAIETAFRDPVRITMVMGGLQLAAIALGWWLVRRRFGPVVALLSTVLFATSGWAVLYARILWPPCFGPLVSVMMLGALWAWAVDRRAWALPFALALAAIESQLHLTGFAWFVLVAAIWVLLRPPLRVGAAVAGAVATILLYAPFLAGLASVGIAAGTKRRALFVDFIGSPIRFFLLSATHGGVDYHFPTLGSDLVRHAPPFALLFAAIPWIAAAGVLAGAILCAPRRREIVLERRFPWIRWSGDSRTAVLFLFAAVPVLSMTFAGLDTSPHYLLVEYPAAFVFLALAADRGIPRGRAAALAATAIVAASGVAFTLALQSWIETRPLWSWSGGYSTPIGDQESAMEWIAADARGAKMRLVSTPTGDPAAPAGRPAYNLQLLLDHLRGEITPPTALAAPPPPDAKRYLVVDAANGGLSPEAIRAIEARGGQNFGALWVCPL